MATLVDDAATEAHAQHEHGDGCCDSTHAHDHAPVRHAMTVRMPATPDDVVLSTFSHNDQMLEISRLSAANLSEPYSIFTFRYFIHGWPDLCIMVLRQPACLPAAAA